MKKILKIYSRYTREIKEINWVDNRLETKFRVNARLTILELNWRNRFKNESTRCGLCNHEIENLKHFLLYCKQYADIRQQHGGHRRTHRRNIDT